MYRGYVENRLFFLSLNGARPRYCAGLEKKQLLVYCMDLGYNLFDIGRMNAEQLCRLIYEALKEEHKLL